jgi:hypothetical protein
MLGGGKIEGRILKNRFGSHARLGCHAWLSAQASLREWVAEKEAENSLARALSLAIWIVRL